MSENRDGCDLRGLNGDVMVLSCSGASNVGQIAHTVARRLAVSGDACFFSLSGIGARIEEKIQTVRKAAKVLMIDGCSEACGKKCMKQAGLDQYTHLVVTEQGISRNRTLDVSEAEISKVIGVCRKLISTGAKGKSCCCG